VYLLFKETIEKKVTGVAAICFLLYWRQTAFKLLAKYEFVSNVVDIKVFLIIFATPGARLRDLGSERREEGGGTRSDSCSASRTAGCSQCTS
jgi:hypothetical protein